MKPGRRGTESFHARRAILTLPKTLVGRLVYTPALPPGRDQLLQREPNGSVVKGQRDLRDAVLARAGPTARRPRTQVRSGSPTTTRRPTAGPACSSGSWRATTAASSTTVGRREAAGRAAVLRSVLRQAGSVADRLLRPRVGEEPYTRGAYGSFNPPGVLTSLRDPLSEPVGSLLLRRPDASPHVARLHGRGDRVGRGGRAGCARELVSVVPSRSSRRSSELLAAARVERRHPSIRPRRWPL